MDFDILTGPLSLKYHDNGPVKISKFKYSLNSRASVSSNYTVGMQFV